MSDFKFNKCDDYTIILTNRSYVPYGHITNYKVDDINIKNNMNSANEFSFTVYKYMTLEDGTEYEEPLWDKITDLKLIYVKETNEYYEITVDGTDSLATYKMVTGKSLCEAELSQYNLYGIEINTEDDIARDEYVQPTLFYRSLDGLEVGSDAYNVAKDSSLLHRILYGSGKANNYKIKHVDESIANLQKTFSIDGKSIYDFFTGDCAEQFNCLFLFDSTDRSISVYDLYSVCMNDDCSYRLSDKDNPRHLRYRGDFKDVCPKCGSKHIKVYGKDTMVIVDKENLTDEISFSTNSDELKNCFHLKAGDDDMTAAIININPNGTAYLYYVPEYQREDMSKELVDKLVTYDELYDSYTNEYEQLMLNLYNAIDWQLYYMDEMMPGAIPPDERESSGSTEIVTKPVETAEQQIPKLSVNNLNYTALSSITSSTSLSTVESAIKNYAKVFVNTSKFKIETIEDSLGSVYQSGGNNCVKWTGKFKVTNFSDKDDTATSSSITLTIYDNYEEFVNQKIKKSIATDDSTGSIYDVLKIQDLEKYKEAIKLYGIVRLQSFIESIKNVEDILIQQGNQAQELYYGKYHNMEIATEKELDARQVQYDAWIDKETKCSNRKSEIQEVLNFENYLGSELYGEFCAYRRDQDYSNDNYVSDGLNNTDLFSNAREFIKTAQEELKKAATLQCNISCKIKNLFALDEFELFWDKFQIGNWITIGYDNEYFRLRLISVQGSLSDFSNIDVEFSSATQVNNITTNIKDVLDQAQSMSTSYSYIAKQSNKGKEANDTISDAMKNGYNAALSMIKSNDHEEIIFNSHGITAQSYNDEINDYDPEKLKITHNVLAFTDDDFKSLKTVLGKVLMPDGTYKFGLNAEVLMGSFLLGKYLTMKNSDNTMTFNENGLYVTNGSNTFHVNPNDKKKFFCLSNKQGDVLYINQDGKLCIQGDGSGIDISSNSAISNLNKSINDSVSALNKSVEDKVSFDDLSTVGDKTIINGGNIKTGTISADLIRGGTIEGCNLNLTDSFSIATQDKEHIFDGWEPRNFVRNWINGVIYTISTARFNNNYEDYRSYYDAAGSCNLYIYEDHFEVNCKSQDNNNAIVDISVDNMDVSSRLILTNEYAILSGKYINLNGTVNNNSDRRIKQNIKDLPDNIEDIYMELSPSEYEFKMYPEKESYGLIAQDVEKILQKHGYTDTNIINKMKVDEKSSYYKYVQDELYSISYDQFHAFHIKMIQLHQKRIEHLEQENKELNEKLESYESRLSKLEEQNKLILEKLNSLGISL